MYVALGAELQHLPLPGVSSTGTCSMPANQYSVLTGRVQDALAESGAGVYSDGLWSKKTCAAWWLVMKEPISSQGVKQLLGSQLPSQCTGTISVPSCPKPTAEEIQAAAVPSAQWQADVGKRGKLNWWVVGGVAAVAVALAWPRKGG